MFWRKISPSSSGPKSKPSKKTAEAGGKLVPPKFWVLSELYGIKPQKTILFTYLP
jgi:hypothetical protein